MIFCHACYIYAQIFGRGAMVVSMHHAWWLRQHITKRNLIPSLHVLYPSNSSSDLSKINNEPGRMCVAYFMSHRINQQTNLSFIFRVLACQGINHPMGMRWVHEAATNVWWRF
jgi:hypothetical protein